MIRNFIEKTKQIIKAVQATEREAKEEQEKKNRKTYCPELSPEHDCIRPIWADPPVISENETGVAIPPHVGEEANLQKEEESDAGAETKKDLTCSLFTVKRSLDKRSELPIYILKERTDIHLMLPECETLRCTALEVEKDGKVAVKKEEVEYELNLDNDTIRLYDKADEILDFYYKHPRTVFLYDDDENCGKISFHCIAVLGESSQPIFADISDMKERIDSIIEYAKLLPEQQSFVNKRREDAKKMNHEDPKKEIYRPLVRREQLQMLYKICKGAYPLDVQKKIEALLGDLNDQRRGSAHTLAKLSFYLGIDCSPVEQKKLCYAEIMHVLDKHINGCGELKELLAECVIELQHSRSSYFSILLYGAPGMGKTSVIDAFCELLNAESYCINCGIANPLQLSGSPDYYENGQASEFAEFLRNMGVAKYYVLALDEVDKAITNHREGSINASLIKILGPQRAYHDNYLEDDIALRHCVVICTANDKSKIPDYIIDRFEGRCFNMGEYNYNEKAEIGKKFILPKELGEHLIPDADLSITDGAMTLMAKDYCEDKGAREIRGCVQAVIRKVLVEWDRGLIPKPFTVDEEYVRTHLKSKKKHQNPMGFA